MHLQSQPEKLVRLTQKMHVLLLLTVAFEEEVHPRSTTYSPPNPCRLVTHPSACETAALLGCHNLMQWDKLFCSRQLFTEQQLEC